MKNKYLFLYLIFASLQTFALKNDKAIKLDSIVTYLISENQTVVSQKSIYSYYPDGNTMSCYDYTKSQNDKSIIGEQGKSYEYDTSGRMTKLTSYTWSENRWLQKYKFEYGYDQNNYKIKEIYSNWDTVSSSWIKPMYETYLKYDEFGNILEMERYTNYGYEGHDYRVGIWKKIFSYNENNDEVLHMLFQWDYNVQDWYCYEKTETEYLSDSITNTQIVTFSRWDQLDSILKPLSRTARTSDSLGRMILVISYDWDSSRNEFRIGSKGEMEYDINGNVVSEIESSYDGAIDEFVYFRKWTYEFNEMNNITDRYFYDWDIETGSWVESSHFPVQTHYENEYNDQGLIISIIVSGFYKEIGYWQNSSKQEFKYDDHSRLISQRSYLWAANEIWENQSKDEYSFDDMGNQTLQAKYTWSNGLWFCNLKWEKVFDANGNVSQQAYYKLDNDLGLLSYSNTDVRFFDLNINSEDIIIPEYPIYDNYPFYNIYFEHVNKILYIEHYKKSDNNSDYLYSVDSLYYSPVGNSSINELDKGNVAIMPNPANQYIYIKNLEDVSTVNFFDLSGRLNKSIVAQPNASIDISSLSMGTYVVKIHSPRGISTGKLIINKNAP